MEKSDYLRFLAGHPSATVAEAAKGLGATEAAVLSAFKRLVRGRLAESSGSPPRFRLTPEGEARLQVLSNQPIESNPSPAGDVAQRVTRLEVHLGALGRRVSASEAAEEEIGADLETLFGAVDRLLDSDGRVNGNPQPDRAQSSSGRAAQLLARAEKLLGDGAASSEPGKAQLLYDALVRLDDASWFKRRAIRDEVDALESQLDPETVQAVRHLCELQDERDSWPVGDEDRAKLDTEIRELRERLHFPAMVESQNAQPVTTD